MNRHEAQNPTVTLVRGCVSELSRISCLAGSQIHAGSWSTHNSEQVRDNGCHEPCVLKTKRKSQVRPSVAQNSEVVI